MKKITKKIKKFLYNSLVYYYDNDMLDFDQSKKRLVSKLHNKFSDERWVQVYLGNGYSMKFLVRYDVILFYKSDKHVFSINVTEFKSFLGGTQNKKYIDSLEKSNDLV